MAKKKRAKTPKQTTPLERLCEYLEGVKPGPVQEKADVKRLEPLLAAAWDDLSCDDNGDMSADKLSGRMHGAHWQPETHLLGFNIERYDGFIMPGTLRPDCQQWDCDLANGTRRFRSYEHREIRVSGCYAIDTGSFAADHKVFYDWLRRVGIPKDGGYLLWKHYHYKIVRKPDVGEVYEFPRIFFRAASLPRFRSVDHDDRNIPVDTCLASFHNAFRLAEETSEGLHFPPAAMELLERSTQRLGYAEARPDANTHRKVRIRRRCPHEWTLDNFPVFDPEVDAWVSLDTIKTLKKGTLRNRRRAGESRTRDELTFGIDRPGFWCWARPHKSKSTYYYKPSMINEQQNQTVPPKRNS